MPDVIIKATDAVAGLFSFALASMLGWRMYFVNKWKQLDRIELKLDNHIEGEGKRQEEMHKHVLDIWKKIGG